MTRTISATNDTASQSEVVRLVVFAELHFESGTVRRNTSPYDFTWGGEDWLGVGDMGIISTVRETSEHTATEVTLGLTGVPAAYVALALGEEYQGRRGSLYLGFLDETHALIDDPVKIFTGRMDTMPIRLDVESEVSIVLVSRLADLFRDRVRRFNNSDQQSLFPGDRGLEFVEEMVEREIVWRP